MYGDFHFLNSGKVLPLERKPLLWKGFSWLFFPSPYQREFLGSSLGGHVGVPGGKAHQIWSSSKAVALEISASCQPYWSSRNFSWCSFHFVTSCKFCSGKSGLCFCIAVPSFLKYLIPLASMTLHSSGLTHMFCVCVCMCLMRQSPFLCPFNFHRVQDYILCVLFSLHIIFEWLCPTLFQWYS